ncbi:MAG: hypothetical protein ABSH20_17085 [Tepidisphaeraceae bacterium]|jgi:hypothetical protein
MRPVILRGKSVVAGVPGNPGKSQTANMTRVVALSVLAKHPVLDFIARSFASTLRMTVCSHNDVPGKMGVCVVAATRMRRLARRFGDGYSELW